MVMRIMIRGRIFHKGGGGDDAEHPTFIPMYTPTTLQTPRGHMTRPRTYAIGIKVNPLFFENITNIHWTCLLPHQSALCVLRYEDRRPQAGEGHPKGVGEGPQGHEEEDGAQQEVPGDPVRTGSLGWTTEGHLLGLHFIPFLHLPIYIPLPPPFRLSKVVDRH